MFSSSDQSTADRSTASGRAGISLAALASNLIALAFVWQASELGVAFRAFALILLPACALLGAVAFVRLVRSSIEDIADARRIALEREFARRPAPEPAHSSIALRGGHAEPADAGRPAAGPWRLTLTTAGMAAVVVSLVVAVCTGLGLEAPGAHTLAILLPFGVAAGTVPFLLHRGHRGRARDASSPKGLDKAATLVPSPPVGGPG